MKKTLIALFALSSVAFAADITLSPLTETTGWTFGHNNTQKNTTPTLNEGTITYANGDWSRGYAVYDLADNIALGHEGHTMTVTTTITSNSTNSCKTLALVGTDQTIVIGGGKWNDAIQMGVTTQESTYFPFQGDNIPDAAIVPISFSAGGVFPANTPVTFSFDIAWEGEGLVATGKYGDTVLGTIDLGSTFTLDKIVISLDGGNPGHIQTVSALSVSAHTPEPATATLSLLALAGLAARRRRH